MQANILILGAGGAARGLLHPLLANLPQTVSITNRSMVRAEALVAESQAFAPKSRLHAVDWAEKEQHFSKLDLLINATSLGMKDQPPLEIDLANLPAEAIVADIVYVPLETPLLRAAKARGLRTLDGLGMLLHQAVPGFERWFGRKPEVSDALRAALIADLTTKG
jgi:shikimate dehydrogenase